MNFPHFMELNLTKLPEVMSVVVLSLCVIFQISQKYSRVVNRLSLKTAPSDPPRDILSVYAIIG